MKSSNSDIIFLSESFENLTDSRKYMLPSEYSESVRYLPKELTPKPGFYDYNYTPYLREIVDHFSPLSNVQEVVFMKPAQIGATTGVLEAAIAYHIGCVPKPQLYVSADKELVEMGMDTKVEKMLDSCDLRHLIASQSNIQKTRKTGDTTARKEYPGGFLHAIGARNPGKLRSMSYPTILFDELDGFPDKLGEEGDPVSLAKNRTNAFESKRKILYLSTPLIMQTSKIFKLYLQGDQRNFYVPCKNCGEFIVLYWHLKPSQTKTGSPAGINFKMTESGRLIAPSVEYICQQCGKPMKNHDKSMFLPHGIWTPTEEPERPEISSYWLNSLYSPPGMYSWEGMVYDWLMAWDPNRNKVKDIEEYKTFRNTKQGLPFEDRGESPRFERVIAHRRGYAKNQINNKDIIKEADSILLILIASCDVQADKIVVDIKGYCRGGANYTIDYIELDGDTSRREDDCWRNLSDIIENRTWVSDDGKRYKIIATAIDSGYRTEVVYNFCNQYSSGVYPIKGVDFIKGGIVFRQMSKKVIEKAGVLCYEINTNMLKDRIAFAMRNDWITGESQPSWNPNFPEDLKDDYFKQFENEYKAERYDKRTNKFLGIYWVKKPGTENEAFDTFVYNIGMLEQVAERACTGLVELGGLGLEYLEWSRFWDLAEQGAFYVDVQTENR